MGALRQWEDLPECMRNESVYPYYEALRRRRGALAAKRLLDILLAAALLAVLWPACLVLAALVKADSRGPALFRQIRVTQYGREFRILKFRTMAAGAEGAGAQVTAADDLRVTRVGRRIRRCRLDEVPQLLNVLRGDMSFVGARPEVPRYVAAYTPEMYATLLLPAGITGEASIAFRDEAALLAGAPDVDAAYVERVLPRKMELSLAEVRGFSLRRQMATMLRTVRAVL